MSACYIEYINSLGEVEVLALTATLQAEVKAVTVVPTEIVEAGYDVSTNAINKGFDISLRGVIASGNNETDPREYLNKLYALRDSKAYFRVVTGDQGVITNSHTNCLFTNIARTQDKNTGIVDQHTAYAVDLQIKAIRLSELATVGEIDPEYIDLLSPKSTTASNTKEVDDRDQELLRQARVFIKKRRDKYLVVVGDDGENVYLEGEDAVQHVYDNLVSGNERLEKVRAENKRIRLKIRNALIPTSGG